MSDTAETLQAVVQAVVEHLGQATSRKVFDRLAPQRSELTLASVSGALRQLQLKRVLRRERIRDDGTYLYRPAESELPPCYGERLRDIADPYIRKVE